MAAPSFLDSMSPWASRGSTPKPPEKVDNEKKAAILSNEHGRDHRISHRHRLSLKDYPIDCPPLSARWFYAVDFPKRKPALHLKPDHKSQPLPPPKKYTSFTAGDSRSIEAEFQKLAQHEEDRSRIKTPSGDIAEADTVGTFTQSRANTNLSEKIEDLDEPSVKVPVNEDYLFDVDIDNRELAPAYWLGPVYDVRRGTWFYQDGSSNRPCEENLATQLEEGYLRTKPWRYEPPQRSVSQGKQRPLSWKPGDEGRKLAATNIKPPRVPSADAAQSRKKEDSADSTTTLAPPPFQLQTYRLFGSYLGTVVTYQDATTAWLLSDDLMSRMSSTVYQRFAGGAHYGGTKVIRGYVDSVVAKDTKSEETGAKEHEQRGRSPGPSAKSRAAQASQDRILHSEQSSTEDAGSRAELKRLATIVGSPTTEDPMTQEEEVRQREEKEIQDDYREAEGDDQGREIEHLVLVTHGIGQRLSIRMESLNFIHDVNVLRKTLKSVYDDSADLQALNNEVDRLPKNCRIQVLPVIWRHLLDFPRRNFKNSDKEQDVADADALGEDAEYPELSDITLQGIMNVRNLVEDLFLDILMFQSSYREHIMDIVQQECNRVYRLFLERNPNFRGKVSLIGHSLGSAIVFDLLCKQKDPARESSATSHRKTGSRQSSIKLKEGHKDVKNFAFDFEVEEFYCLGSPIGLFQMLDGKTIAGRRAADVSSSDGSSESNSLADAFVSVSSPASASTRSDRELTSANVSSPKCAQLFNIFHPLDPIAYRLEPLISPAMKTLKPQPLPYIKKGILGAPVAGLSSFGNRVGQSVSGLWSNLTTGVTNSLISKSLGLSSEMGTAANLSRAPLSMGAGTNIHGGVVSATDAAEAQKDISEGSDPGLEHPPTLIDPALETLYARFQKQHKSITSDGSRDLGESAQIQEAEDRARRLRKEEMKVRLLNSTGRVDFSIQEGYFDISMLEALASHLTYWADKDVSHFIISQLLSRQRVMKR